MEFVHNVNNPKSVSREARRFHFYRIKDTKIYTLASKEVWRKNINQLKLNIYYGCSNGIVKLNNKSIEKMLSCEDELKGNRKSLNSQF